MKPETYLDKLRAASKRELMATVMELARRCYDLELREPLAVSRPQAAWEQVKDIARALDRYGRGAHGGGFSRGQLDGILPTRVCQFV